MLTLDLQDATQSIIEIDEGVRKWDMRAVASPTNQPGLNRFSLNIELEFPPYQMIGTGAIYGWFHVRGLSDRLDSIPWAQGIRHLTASN